MAGRHQVIPRTLCFIFHKNEVLLMEASSKKDWAGMFNPLGGHIEKGESVLDSAKREIKEESGLNVTGIKLRGIIHSINFYGKNVMLFVTSSYAKTKTVSSNNEGTLHWVKRERLESLKMFEDIKPILEHVLEMKSSEIFVGTTEYDGKDKLVSIDIKIS